MDQKFDFERSARERRNQIGEVLKKAVECSPENMDIHSNSQDVHPIDVLANTIENYGIAYLVSILKKKRIFRSWLIVCN